MVSAVDPHAHDVIASLSSPHHGIPFSDPKTGSSERICATRS